MRIRFALALLASLGSAGAAQASPQILALLSTEGVVALACEGSSCIAELSAFCLEEKRATPQPGTAYRIAPGSGVVLVVTGDDGLTREIDAAPHARFVSLRDMTAVQVSVDRSGLGDAARVAIRAGTASVLLPEPTRRDGRAHTPAEVAHATGILRARAARIVDASPAAAVARDLSRAINLLRAGDEAAALLLAGDAAPLARACVAKVAETKSQGRGLVGVTSYWSGRRIVAEPLLRHCVEEAHGTLMTSLNRRYWRGEAGAAAPPRPALRM